MKLMIRPDPDIELNCVLIPVTTEHKFLSVVLDEKLTYISYMKQPKHK